MNTPANTPQPGPRWDDVAPGVWRARVGAPDPVTPLAALGVEPRLDTLRAMGFPTCPFPAGFVSVDLQPGRTVIRVPLQADEKLFGFGLQFFRLNQRGRTRFLRVNSDPRQDTGETHAPVPFCVSSAGYGLLINTARIVTAYCASCVRQAGAATARDRTSDAQWSATPLSAAMELVVPADGTDLFLFAGPDLLDVVRRYNLYSGGGTLPPRWALGFWHRVHFQYRDSQVLAEARQFRSRGFPCDVIGLEPGWHSRSYPCTFAWSPERFPDPAGFVATLAVEGFHVNLWEHPYVSPESSLASVLQPYSGSHTVWGGLAPDLTIPAAVQAIQEQHGRDHVSLGVGGYKLDECDGSELTNSSWMFPAHASFPSGLDGEQMRQLYGLLLQKLTADLFRRQNRRTLGLVRASGAWAANLPYALYSDLYDHRQFVRALCNSGFCGLLWTPEVRTADSAEEWVRRMQTVCFSPVAMLNAWASSTLPWGFPEAETAVRKCMELRMRLVPYLYAAFAEYCLEGTPPFRAMAFEAGQGSTAAPGAEAGPKDPADIDDQFLVGPSLLVAPLFAGQSSREVWVPPGNWYDFFTAARFTGPAWITVSAALDQIPLFVRDGGIVPLMPVVPFVPVSGTAIPLEIRHYGERHGRLRLFDDDGETFAFERGRYRWRVLETTNGPDGRREGRMTDAPADWVSAYGELTWSFLPTTSSGTS